MAPLTWDEIGERLYEVGVDHGVLYIPSAAGAYDTGVAWNGLTTVTESPSGAEPSPQYADNIKYLNLISAEEFGGTIEAFTYPEEFGQCDGTVAPSPGVSVGQQPRKSFGLCYRSRVGNDVEGVEAGYKLHLLYGCQASPSEKAYATINDSPEAIAFSWDFTSTPAPVTDHKPTSLIVVDSTVVDAAELKALEDVLYGSTNEPTLPTPDEVLAMFGGGSPAPPAATGADAGTPGSWTPAGAAPPADVVTLQSSGIVANPATLWTTGQYVVTADLGEAHWDSTAWVVGRAL